MKKMFIMMIILTLGVGILSADCRMMAMSAHKGYDLTITQNFLDDYLDELQLQGGSGGYHPNNNTDGWGLISYEGTDMQIEHIFRDDQPAHQSNDFNTAQNIIANSNAQVVMGHVRKATSNSVSGIDNPHPFVFSTPKTDYTFMHNGSVEYDDYIDLINNLHSGWLQQHPITYYPQSPHRVDSEALFSWIMLNIHLKDYNVLEGLIAAIQGMPDIALYGEDRTFVLSDGIDLYCYKNSTDDYVNHDLLYEWENGLDNDTNGRPWWIVMSKFPDGTSDSDIAEIANDELVYLAHDGFKVSIENCSAPNAEIKHNRKLFAGWNWEYFPIFPTDTSNGPTILSYLESHGGITNVVNGPDDIAATHHNLFSWNPSNFQLNDKTFYKLNMTNTTQDVHSDYAFGTTGTLRDRSTPLIAQVAAREEYWVGYDLINSQRIDKAFGDNWSNVKSIKAQNWAYSAQDRSVGTSDKVPIWSPEGKYLQFGKGYIITFFQGFNDFNWVNNHENPTDIPTRKAAEFFSFETKADYLAIDILESEIRSEILEIAAFQDGNCIGATGVNYLPLQLLAYANPAGGEITLQVHTGERNAKQAETLLMDPATGVMQKKAINPRTNQPLIVKLDDLIEISEQSRPLIKSSNYPNPFNPTTEISFDLPQTAQVKLEIYNIKGQKIKTLAASKMDKGTHSVIWKGDDENNKPVSSGIYLYQITAGEEKISKRMLLLK